MQPRIGDPLCQPAVSTGQVLPKATLAREVRLNVTTTALSVRAADPVSDPVWQALTATCPAASLFHSPPWMQTIADCYGFQIRGYVATTASGEPAGAIAYSELDDFAGRRMVCIPFSDTFDPLVTSVEAWLLLLTSLQSHGLPLHFRCLSENCMAETKQIALVKKARWHRIPVQGSIEEIWRRITPEGRRAIRRSQRAGVEVQPLCGEDRRAGFHKLHVALRKTKYRLLAQPLRLFELLEQRFQETGGWHSLAAYLGPEMIAGTIYLHWGDTLYYKFNASAADQLHARPNNRLVWEGLQLAKSLGCRYLDLGPSDDDQPGLIRFKRGFGAEERELRFLRWTPETMVEISEERRRVLSEVTRSMTDPAVPDEVASQAGSVFYRFFA